MGYAGKVEERAKARKLRSQGASIKEIERKLNVSRSSVSIWCRDIQLSDAQMKKLYASKKSGALKGSIIASKKKVQEREALTRRLHDEALKEIGKLDERDLFISGIALYAAEGEKKDGTVGLSNSDPRIIKMFLNWLIKFGKIDELRLRASLYLHDNLDELEAKKYWSKITKIPLSQFCKTYIVINNNNSFRKTRHEHGICRVRFCDVKLHRKIIGYINGILENQIIPR